MDAEVLHSGFDSLKFTVTTDIPPDLRAELTEAKAQAVRTNRDAVIERGGMSFAVRRTGGMAFSVIPAVVRTVNRAEHNRLLERQMLGLAVSRAAAEDIEGHDAFARVLQGLVPSLADLSRDHPAPIEERLARVRARLLFR